MKSPSALPLVALIGAASIVPISVAAFSSTGSTSDVDVRLSSALADTGERYGVVQYDTAARRWAIASSPPFESKGLTGVSCSASTGVLTVAFTPLDSIGTFTAEEDDAYAGRYAVGAGPNRQNLFITFHRPSTGAVVPCNATELRIPTSSVQVWVRGTPPQQPMPPSTVEPSFPLPSQPTPPETPSPGPPPSASTSVPQPPTTVTGTSDPAPSIPPSPPTAGPPIG